MCQILLTIYRQLGNPKLAVKPQPSKSVVWACAAPANPHSLIGLNTSLKLTVCEPFSFISVDKRRINSILGEDDEMENEIDGNLDALQ